MKTRRTPFYGGPEDRHILSNVVFDEMANVPPELLAPFEVAQVEHEHATWVSGELGTDIALGFMPHDGENRQKRRAEVATWQPPKVEGEQPPTRRELLKQRQNQRRGKLDPELRRLQKRKAAR